jgi:hypothetical protein
MPVMARTRREIATTAELGPEYAALLTSAHTTNAATARKVEQIIAEFRRDGRALVDTATTAPDGDGLIDLASHALREALTVVDDAQSEMDERNPNPHGANTETSGRPCPCRSRGPEPNRRRSGRSAAAACATS